MAKKYVGVVVARQITIEAKRRPGQFAVGRSHAALAIHRICEQRTAGTTPRWCQAGRPSPLH
jgi:hypothetical protein